MEPLNIGTAAVLMDNQGKADALDGYFGSVHRTDDSLPGTLEIETSPVEIGELQLSEELVRQRLEVLDVHEAAGPE
ncbi:unnamed protein product [Echinostoma caproni]|uniref:CN hydrolase domain-containing protein n=1 Tax=Echinostoma caproni TaxID=27848 RepID=A0A183AXQ7_9TREM|nr:unnamed protein product [Echinostoma caproni]